MLRSCGELLPLACPYARLHVYNPTRILDALDENASDIVRFSSGRIMTVQEYVFRPHVVAGVDLFKLPNLRASPTFVSEEYVDAWSSAGLVGLEFKQVWAAT